MQPSNMEKSQATFKEFSALVFHNKLALLEET